MYPSLHNKVSDLLRTSYLSFTFHDKDSSSGSIDDYDTNIMGHFTCRNPTCHAVWASKKIPITIRRYAQERYNTRVYYQACKRCGTTSQPSLDEESYVERVAYRLKKWAGVQMEIPPFRGVSKGPHLDELCEGCKDGHCSALYQ
jgi:hypothetical protein